MAELSAQATTVDFNFGVAEANDFILDDATRGVLDGSTYRLADGFSSVTADVTSVTIRRGRFSQLFDVFDAGSCTIALDNQDRTYDPQYSSSPYYGYIIPGRQVRITTGTTSIFVGKVEDWNFEYDVSTRSTAIAQATDALGQFGYQNLINFTPTGGQLPGARLIDVANNASWPIVDTDFDPGVSTLQADTPDANTNDLSYMQEVAKSDLGYLFASRTGVLTFRDRHHLFNGVMSGATFGPAGIGITSVAISYGTEQLYSTVTVTRDGGTAQTVTLTSIQDFVETYGVPRSLAVSGLLLETDTQSLDMATYLLGIYDTPEYRIDSVTVQLAGLTTGNQNLVLGLEIGSLVAFSFTPNNVGSPITQDLVVQGIRHDIAPKSHLVTFAFVSSASREFFQLDSADFGVLNVNALAF